MGQAVFLSYAREDAEPALRIADALRGFGIEVWFDQSELRGGDAWDQKIRRQIKECALFIPVISPATQSRGEGYFRLEWKLAVERSHLMAEGTPFLMPIALRGQTDADAIVPVEFLKVQWTALPDGAPTPALIEQVRRLLAGGKIPAPRAAAPPPVARDTFSGTPPSGAGRRVGWLIAGLAVFAAAVSLALVFALRSSHGPAAAPAASPSAPAPAEPAPVPAAIAPVDDKSIAVLPFENLSDEKDSAFFTDGIQEDILTNLAVIHDLRVVSRTSAEQYRNTTKPSRQIGTELHVAYLLEGSVRRAGNRVRVTGQLIKADSDQPVWGQAYNRDLNDIFAIQSEIAQSIASALETQLSTREQDLIEKAPTRSVPAYERFLQARHIAQTASSPLSYRKALALYEEAVRLDPAFATAWGEIADRYAHLVFTDYADDVPEALARGQAALDHATALAPDDPDVIIDAGTYYYWGYRDYARAEREYSRVAALQPNNPGLCNALQLIERRQGRWAEALAHGRRAVALDPSNLSYLGNCFATLFAVNRWQEGLGLERRYAAMVPDQLLKQMQLAIDVYEYTGSTAEGDALIAGLTPEQSASAEGREARKQWAWCVGRLTESIALDRAQPYYDAQGSPHYIAAFVGAIALSAAGDGAGARARIQDALGDLESEVARHPANFTALLYLGGDRVLLGQTKQGFALIDRSLALRPASRDAFDFATARWVRAIMQSWAGDLDGSVAILQELARQPGSGGNLPTPYTLQSVPWYHPLRDDPRAKEIAGQSLKPLL